jgi:putative membrane protein
MNTTRGLRQFRLGLAIALAALSLWAAIRPVSRFDWFMENLLVWIAVVVIASLRNQIVLSRTAYALTSLFLAIQIYGSHYAYEPEVGNWVSSLFGSPRNSFDRVVHSAFGLLLFVPVTELLEAAVGATRKSAMFLAIVALTAFGAAYEIIEWSSVVLLDPHEAAVFVGLQGDPWDAQKDMALGLSGSIVAYVLAWLSRRGRTSLRAPERIS